MRLYTYIYMLALSEDGTVSANMAAPATILTLN